MFHRTQPLIRIHRTLSLGFILLSLVAYAPELVASPILTAPAHSEHVWKNPEDPDFEVKWDSGTPRLYWNHDDTTEPLVELKILPAGTLLYHWGTAPDAEYYDQIGHIPADVLDQKVNHPNDFFQGGGFYVSSNPIDSQAFGPALVVVELEQDLLFVSASQLREKDGLFPPGIGFYARLNGINRALRVAGVHALIAGIHDSTTQSSPGELEDWYNLIRPEALSKISSRNQGWLREDPEISTQFIRGEPSDPTGFARVENTLIDFLSTTVIRKKDPQLFENRVLRRILDQHPGTFIKALKKHSSEITDPSERTLLHAKMDELDIPHYRLAPFSEWTWGEWLSSLLE